MRILATWEVASVFGAVAVCYAGILGIVWKIFEHAYQGDKHPDKKDIVFRDVCETKHTGESRVWEAELKAANSRVDGLKEQVEKGFSDIKADVGEIKGILLQFPPNGHKS
jgi:hypothetical protein